MKSAAESSRADRYAAIRRFAADRCHAAAIADSRFRRPRLSAASDAAAPRFRADIFVIFRYRRHYAISQPPVCWLMIAS